MKDNRAFILREDKAEEFLSKPKNKPGKEVNNIDRYTRELQKQSVKQKTKLLGEELRNVREGITDEKVLIGYNMAIAICNKHLAENDDLEDLDTLIEELED